MASAIAIHKSHNNETQGGAGNTQNSPYVIYKSVQAGIGSCCYFIWMFVSMNRINVDTDRFLVI